MTHKKPNLPTKICPVCNRPFSWRKKWAKVWEQVRYCSDGCRRKSKSFTLKSDRYKATDSESQ
ncbi:DUF2256 domain-containing protein [Planctopirus ephydatiae]|uniref:DUF2256 domain-containing protein n=1 Tax=Planctopirus ephydatiae TaxID=2528019 RepID=UPI0011A2F192|nr:DUF2256 domain-containing protein [Planctopirus ephydatiae]